MSATVVTSEAAPVTSSAPRRKSGRVSKKPEPFVPAPSPAASAKRKRAAVENEDGSDGGEQSSEDDPEESSEGEPDEEELREKRRKKKGKAPARKPAPKKPKTNGETVSLAIRPATNATAKPKKPRKAPIRVSAITKEADGLYGEIFAQGKDLDDVAAQWVARFQHHEARAVADVVNFVLRASGCDIQIDEDDIADPDNCANRLTDIQEEYQAQGVTEYPLISRARGGAAFKNALRGFFISLVRTIAQTGLLYDNAELIENIQVWISTMSSASNRPFRHTATVAALAVTSGLAYVASDLVEIIAKKNRQSESEAKKSRVNKTRVASINKEVDELKEKLEIVDSSITDWFDTVYVHRYRDVDPKIRVECVEGVAEWIMIYSDKFFDGTHLRYLGWILSDPTPSTRVEVLKQLTKLFRDQDKLAGLKTFTERFRPRIVEIATRDADTSVRAAAVDLLDILREAGFLEPDDIDAVGKLIFDAETRVRKSVVGFFAENVNAAYEAIVDEMGGQEALDEALSADDDDEEYTNPRLEWLKLKCLVDQLLLYDEEEAELPSQMERITPSGAELGLVAAGIESRFSLAAQALYDAIPEVRSWEVLAGYLLYDHSQTAQDAAGDDAELMLRQNCKLEERQETALLDILNAAVRLRLQRLVEAQKDKKKTKAQREAEQEEQAETAKKLSVLIPQLLKKFGALPEAAALCLRLERELNLEVFEELRQNAALSALLDDINKQFLTHQNERVLNEAIGSILHAQGNEELKELIEVKVKALWDDLINTFDALRRGKDFSKRGNLGPNILTGVSNIVLKMSELAKASDPAILDQLPAPPKSKSRKDAVPTTPPITSLLQILERGVSGSALDSATDAAEDALVRHTMSLMLFYFLWKCRDCSVHIQEETRIPDEELTAIADRRDTCMKTLMRIMEARKGADELRLDAANLLLDLYNMYHPLKSLKPQASKAAKRPQARKGDEPNDDWEALCQEIDDPTTKTLLRILTAAESNLAKRMNRRLEEGDVDDEPVDPDDEPESSDDEEEEAAVADKQIRKLLADERLCSLGGRIVQAIHVGSFDAENKKLVRKHLERNKTKLSHDWKEVVGHLDIVKSLKVKGAKKTAKAAKEPAKAAKSREIIIEDDSDEDEQEQEQEQEHEEHREEDEDEEMAENEEHVNGEVEAEAHENGAAPEQSPEVESVLGD
ncbi:STAG-domain-containing protein [Corynespora cassiicola Philippines]|uniref:STAG-domain-containing protein n=1 Tax=Corynespora cassiicola Philippines TaxID=1448308 RepID=A0A2T2NKF1_CORCC|nr:STAG-domain-containing protein [Corynespora cassiicola Philippines]